jgi:hypothetical protein
MKLNTKVFKYEKIVCLIFPILHELHKTIVRASLAKISIPIFLLSKLDIKSSVRYIHQAF